MDPHRPCRRSSLPCEKAQLRLHRDNARIDSKAMNRCLHFHHHRALGPKLVESSPSLGTNRTTTFLRCFPLAEILSYQKMLYAVPDVHDQDPKLVLRHLKEFCVRAHHVLYGNLLCRCRCRCQTSFPSGFQNSDVYGCMRGRREIV